MTTPPFLNPHRLRAELAVDGPYRTVDVVRVTGSTNTDLIESAARGEADDRAVLFAEEQTSGRGRNRRSWVSPAGYGLHVSVLLRPSVPRTALAWLPLIAGIALAETVCRVTGLRAALKWPNDLLLGSDGGWFKAAGILAEGNAGPDGMAVVVGIGVNVHHQPADLPSGAGALPATSLAARGAQVDREEFGLELLASFAELDDLWRRHGGDVVESGLFDRYQRLCGTLGNRVRVELGQRNVLDGTATEVDGGGRLVVRGLDGATTPVSAGDVVHLRPVAE